jgi:hypothetical protein
MFGAFPCGARGDWPLGCSCICAGALAMTMRGLDQSGKMQQGKVAQTSQSPEVPVFFSCVFFKTFLTFLFKLQTKFRF